MSAIRRQTIGHNATIYNYQLVRKIKLYDEPIWSYLFIILLLIAFQAIFYQWAGITALVISFLIVHLVHYTILKLTMIRVEEAEDQRWGWRIGPPWIGFLPVEMVELALFRRLHRHLLWIGLCAIALAYPWVPGPAMISLVFWHLWTVAPRLLILRKLRKNKKNGLLRLQSREVLYYHR